MRDAVLSPLGGDEGGHRYRPIASLTQRATERLSTSRCIASSAFSFRSRTSSARSYSLNARSPSPRRRGPRHPVTQRALVHPEIPGHLRDRLAGLPDHPHRALPEVLIELPRSLPSPLPLWRCLHATRGTHGSGWRSCSSVPWPGRRRVDCGRRSGKVEDGKPARAMEWLSRSPGKRRPARDGSFPAAIRRIAEAHSVQVSDG